MILHRQHEEALAGRHVHLGEQVTGEQQRDCERGRRRQRHPDQQYVRDQVREHHGVDQPEPGRQPRGQQQRQAGQDLHAEECPAECGGQVHLEADVEPVGDQALEHEAARERVEREERGEAMNERAGRHRDGRSRAGGARRVRAHERVGRHLDEAAQEEDREEDARRGSRAAHRGGPERGGAVAGQVVEAEGRGQTLPRGRPGDRDLLEGQERARLAGAHRQVADHGRRHDEPGLLGHEEDESRDDDQAGLGQQRDPRPIALGGPPDRERHGRAREQGEGDRDPDLPGSHPVFGQIDREEHAEEAVAEGACGLGREDEAPVRGHAGALRR